MALRAAVRGAQIVNFPLVPVLLQVQRRTCTCNSLLVLKLSRVDADTSPGDKLLQALTCKDFFVPLGCHKVRFDVLTSELREEPCNSLLQDLPISRNRR